MYTISCRSEDREEVLAPQISSASVLAHTFEAPSNLRLLAPAMQRKHNSFLPNIASPRPWGINSRGGERSFTRRCERQVRRGAPFIGGGGNPKGVAGAWGCPLALASSCGWTLHSQISFKFPPLKSPLKFPLNFHQI